MANYAKTLTDSFENSGARRSSFAQSLVLDRLSALKRGILNIRLPNGDHLKLGEHGPEATITIHRNRFFRRLISHADIGAGEAYMDGDWDSPDLAGLTRLFLDNEDLFNPHPILGAMTRLANRLNHLAKRNTVSQAKKNIADHYDLSNDLYSLFLDPSMTYSSAVFPAPESSLYEAQSNKYRKLAERAGITSEHHVLEIGCGWGGFAEFAARTYGCRITGITLSAEQARFARRRMKRLGLDELVDIQIIDYRQLEGSFDAIVSIEMLEAVGHEYLDSYFASCEKLLAPQGRAAIQVITIADQHYDTYRRSTDFIRRYIFPGGHLPSLNSLVDAMTRQSALVVQDVENIGVHYAETLRRWRAAFSDRISEIQSLGFDERFCRMWEFYLTTCEAGFDHGKINTLQLALARPGHGAVPSPFTTS